MERGGKDWRGLKKDEKKRRMRERGGSKRRIEKGWRRMGKD